MSTEPAWIGAMRNRYEETGGVYFDDLLEHLPIGSVFSTPAGTWIREPADTITTGEVSDASTWWRLDAIDRSSFRPEVKYVFSGDGIHVAVCDEFLRSGEGDPRPVVEDLESDGTGPNKIVDDYRSLLIREGSPIAAIDIEHPEFHVGREAER